MGQYGQASAPAAKRYVSLQHNEDRQSQNRRCGCTPHGETVNGKRKGVTQWETKAGKRIRTRVRNRRQANRSKRQKRSRISNRKALRESSRGKGRGKGVTH